MDLAYIPDIDAIKQSFVIEGRLSGLNELINSNRTNKFEGAKLKRSNMDIVRMYIRKAKLVPVKHKVMVGFLWHEPNAKRDLDNVASGKKFILDALVEEGVLPNDSQKWVYGLFDNFCVDKEHPHIKVVILEDREGDENE